MPSDRLRDGEVNKLKGCHSFLKSFREAFFNFMHETWLDDLNKHMDSIERLIQKHEGLNRK